MCLLEIEFEGCCETPLTGNFSKKTNFKTVKKMPCMFLCVKHIFWLAGDFYFRGAITQGKAIIFHENTSMTFWKRKTLVFDLLFLLSIILHNNPTGLYYFWSWQHAPYMAVKLPCCSHGYAILLTGCSTAYLVSLAAVFSVVTQHSSPRKRLRGRLLPIIQFTIKRKTTCHIGYYWYGILIYIFQWN